ncbi:hypothetical protein MRB53_004006 [Persea americana]|uniref:Uncharacterized protein n=1 Tax=Persea americana TaxID=3435 RepID=A0ACC2MZV9_PERAE|nr:hypothetical protein MRB53_004006 [Persea americana]
MKKVKTRPLVLKGAIWRGDGNGSKEEEKEKAEEKRRSRSPNSLPQPPETFPLEKKKKDSIVFFCHPHSDLNERGRRRAIPTDFNLPEPLLHSTWPHDRILLIV